MKNKNDANLLKAFISLRLYGYLDYFSDGLPMEESQIYENLGSGYELRPIELTNSKGDPIDNDSKYSHLYHRGIKISDSVFRKGGMGGTYKEGYCELIKYEPGEDRYGFDSGTFVIVNETGDVCLRGESYSSGHPHHIGGNLASLGNNYYDLRTGSPIAPKSSSSLVGSGCLIFEHKYSWYNKETSLELGIYKIDLKTCEILKIDDIRR